MTEDKLFYKKTVVCIASGPSLNKADCDLIDQSELPTIAVNLSWKMARFAKIIYAGDLVWWQNYGHEIDIDAIRWTCCQRAADEFNINFHNKRGSYNSGLRAVELAFDLGASKVLLLGYDASIKHGVHWHEDYTKTRNPDFLRCNKWLSQFDHLKNKPIINCAPKSALTQFKKMTIREALLNEDCLS